MKKIQKSFFEKPRQQIDVKESRNDIIPFDWKQDVLDGKKKVTVKLLKNQ